MINRDRTTTIALLPRLPRRSLPHRVERLDACRADDDAIVDTAMQATIPVSLGVSTRWCRGDCTAGQGGAYREEKIALFLSRGIARFDPAPRDTQVQACLQEGLPAASKQAAGELRCR